MWIELEGIFYKSCSLVRKAYVNTDNIDFFINTKEGDGTCYIFIRSKGHYIQWICADEGEMLKRYEWLKSVVHDASKPIKLAESEPIEEITDVL